MAIPKKAEETSVVVLLPVHNEELNLLRVAASIDADFQAALPELGLPFLLFVDDGSSDASRSIIQQLIDQRGNVCCLGFSRNFGHQAAVMAGLAYTPENCIVLVMDADGQDPSIVGTELVRRVLEGVDIAYGIRKKREGSILKRIAYWNFYRILSWLSMIEIPLDAGDFCAYSPRAAKLLATMKEQHPYVRGLRAWIGLTQVGVPYHRPDRYAGETSYNVKRLFKLAFDGIISFSLKPLRIAMVVGFATFFLCMLLGFAYLMFYIFDVHLFGASVREVPGFTTLILVVLAFSGLQMMMLGVIGEYLGRVFEQAKGRPLFIVAETLGSLKPQSIHEQRQSNYSTK